MKPIATTYNGIRFRSRLEARVALMLDTHGIEWHYEPEGYELSDGTRYLPDFWLPRIRTYIEVKGEHVPGEDKTRRFALELNGWGDGRPEVVDQDEIDDAWTHPETLVLIGRLGAHFSGKGERLSAINALGASVISIQCKTCTTNQWVNIGGFRCRACSADMRWEAYHGSPFGAAVELPRLPQWRPR